MQTKDLLYKNVAEELGQPVDLVELVVSTEYKRLLNAAKIHDQLEISGFGVFSISAAKIRRRIEKYEKILFHLGNMEQSEKVMKKIGYTTDALAYHKERLKKYE